MTGVLADLLADLLGDLVGDRSTGRRAARRQEARLARFAAGRPVRVAARCDGRRGRLTVEPGRMSWRMRGTPVVVRRGEADPVGLRERGRRRVAVRYRIAGQDVEFVLRRRDLPLLARVLELPPTRVGG
jgi:hypothetical protein